MSSEEVTLYLTEQKWARVIAKVWLDDDLPPGQRTGFREQLETNPVKAIREYFPDFEFDLLSTMPERPEGISDAELEGIVNGEITVIPDRFVRL